MFQKSFLVILTQSATSFAILAPSEMLFLAREIFALKLSPLDFCSTAFNKKGVSSFPEISSFSASITASDIKEVIFF